MNSPDRTMEWSRRSLNEGRALFFGHLHYAMLWSSWAARERTGGACNARDAAVCASHQCCAEQTTARRCLLTKMQQQIYSYGYINKQ